MNKAKSSPPNEHLALPHVAMSSEQAPHEPLEPVSTVDFTPRRSPSPLTLRTTNDHPHITSPTKNGFAPPYAPPPRLDSSDEPYAVGTPLDPYGSGSSSAHYSSGEISPLPVFTPLTLTLEEKRKAMSLAAKQEQQSEDPLAKLGFKPLVQPQTPGSPFGFSIPPAASASSINRRDSNAPEKLPLTESTGYWLAWYFVFNLGLTLYNKVVLVNFPFPYVSRRLLPLERVLIPE
jgi:hypothetical protein